MLTAAELSLVQSSQVKYLMILALGFVAPLELLAGIFTFLARNERAATGLTLLGAAWSGTALILLGTSAAEADRPPARSGQGLPAADRPMPA
jgi:uncharacterized protein